MGLLDDAIREHLDLKRRRGADPAEVERAEREALGPVRRNRDPSAADVLEGEPSTATAYEDGESWLASDDEDVEPLVASAYADPDDAVASDLTQEAFPATALHEAPVAYDREGRDDSGDASPVDFAGGHDEPFPAESAESARRSGPPPSALSDETSEYDVSEALGTQEDEGEDVLEETPEFLQDTPDHDRLWFEQRPPRDFDFDG
jgi:hypothetical protein